MPTLGVIFPPDQPPEALRDAAVAAEAAGLDRLWLWEDCFKESGIAPAAAVLAWTPRLAVGIGLLPVPLRNVALTAMELASLERLFPGRVVPGVGHGVLDWMGQVGARAASPMTLLREYTTALQSLLHGATVTTAGRYVSLQDVALDWPPSPPPPLLVGAVGDRTLELAGELGDGTILTSEATPERLPQVLERIAAGRARAGRDGTGEVVVFVTVPPGASAAEAADRVAAYTAAGATDVALHALGDDVDVAAFARLVGEEVRPRLA